MDEAALRRAAERLIPTYCNNTSKKTPSSRHLTSLVDSGLGIGLAGAGLLLCVGMEPFRPQHVTVCLLPLYLSISLSRIIGGWAAAWAACAVAILAGLRLFPVQSWIARGDATWAFSLAALAVLLAITPDAAAAYRGPRTPRAKTSKTRSVSSSSTVIDCVAASRRRSA